MLIRTMVIEGTLSQILALLLDLYDFENHVHISFSMFPDFWHKIKTKTSIKNLRHCSLHTGLENVQTELHAMVSEKFTSKN